MEVNLGCTVTLLLVGADNQAALSFSHDDVQTERSKHIDMKYQFIRDHIMRGTIVAQYVSTDGMVADVMAKALGRIKHKLFFKLMKLRL